jgi:exopolysaccharide production protein ExoY
MHLTKRQLDDIVKRTMDVVGALTALIVFSPILLIAAVLIKLDGGPILFVQQRVGRNGRMFGMLKLRTMVPDAHKMEAFVRRAQSSAGGYGVAGEYSDPRITKVGAVLRLLNMDELPQFVNVLLGDMSLVGPRPVPEEESYLYGNNRDEILSVSPGITGYWQIKRRMDTSYCERVELDSYYVRNRNVLLDAYILIQTPASMLTSDYNSVTKPLPPAADGVLVRQTAVGASVAETQTLADVVVRASDAVLPKVESQR